MSTAMYSGVSGLKAQQTKLDVIGNNIANVSTAGYKSQRVSFSDILSQKLSAATAPKCIFRPRQVPIPSRLVLA